MSMFKCKMCGGTLDISSGMTVAECQYCGTKQTLPRLDDEKKANLYDRANYFRRNGEFDKAMSIYEQILNEDNTDAEAYWSLVLGRYGIEYVEDPMTHKRIPTVNRTQMISIFADEDYKSALKYADGYQRGVYEAEAKAIDEIQKGILNISRQEEPFDVFICYKEKDKMGRRTQDSVLANDLYHQLTEEGFKVFFARITLENKLGTAYEPYIFAALNSAKVMVVLGTKPEYFKAVWVKNEWFRYLTMIRNGAKKMLIPAYKDMNPYDLPEEFSHLQALDMSQIGFLQDLIRGIKKVVEKEAPQQESHNAIPVNMAVGTVVSSSLLRRVFLFLEDCDWESADEYSEKVLDLEPENAMAYLGKLMAQLQVSKQEGLADYERPFDNNPNYRKILRFGDQELQKTVEGYVQKIKERNENAMRERERQKREKQQSKMYEEAYSKLKYACNDNDYLAIAQIFQQISGFRDADALAQQCLEKGHELRKARHYEEGNKMIENYHAYVAEHGYNFEDAQPLSLIQKAIHALEDVSELDGVEQKLAFCRSEIPKINQKLEEDRVRKEEKRKRQEHAARIKNKIRKIRNIVLTVAFVSGAVFIGYYCGYYIPEIVPKKEQYQLAMDVIESKRYIAAIAMLEELGGYKDSKDQIERVKDKMEEQRKEARHQNIFDVKEGDILFFGEYEQDNDKGNGKEDIEWIVLKKKKNKLLLISSYCLDCQPYGYGFEWETLSWQESFIRGWLNNEFMDEAFEKEERKAISKTKVKNYFLAESGRKEENDTKDQVFLLSIEETEKYFESRYDRVAKDTDYVIDLANRSDLSYDKDEWLLRTIDKDGPSFVWRSGGISHEIEDISEKSYGIRPAFWLDLEKLK